MKALSFLQSANRQVSIPSKLSVTTFEVIIAFGEIVCLTSSYGYFVSYVKAHEGGKVFTNRRERLGMKKTQLVLIYIKQDSPSLSSQRKKWIRRVILTIW
jgi:hypothetical protein